MPRTNPEQNPSLSIVDRLTAKIKQARLNNEEDSAAVQIPLLARRLEKSLVIQRLINEGKVVRTELPMAIGFRAIEAEAVLELTFGYAGRRKLIGYYRDNRWTIEYWYGSESEPKGKASAATAEMALISLLPVFIKTNAWQLQSSNR